MCVCLCVYIYIYIYRVGTIKLSPLEKTTWFHFRLMKTGFLFVADHLLVGQLCTNPKSDRSLLSCLKVTQCSLSEIGDAPLYNSGSLPIQVMKTGLLPAWLKCKSGLFNAWGHCSTHRTTLRTATLIVCIFGMVSSEGHIIDTSYLRSRLESQHQSVPVCAEECGDPLVQSGGRWQTLIAAEGLCAGQHVQRDPSLASARVLRLCTILSLAPFLPWPEPARLLRLAIRREYHQHDLPQHQSQPDRRHPPSIRRAPAGACGKGMLPIPDRYRGGDWG